MPHCDWQYFVWEEHTGEVALSCLQISRSNVKLRRNWKLSLVWNINMETRLHQICFWFYFIFAIILPKPQSHLNTTYHQSHITGRCISSDNSPFYCQRKYEICVSYHMKKDSISQPTLTYHTISQQSPILNLKIGLGHGKKLCRSLTCLKEKQKQKERHNMGLLYIIKTMEIFGYTFHIYFKPMVAQKVNYNE